MYSREDRMQTVELYIKYDKALLSKIARNRKRPPVFATVWKPDLDGFETRSPKRLFLENATGCPSHCIFRLSCSGLGTTGGVPYGSSSQARRFR